MIKTVYFVQLCRRSPIMLKIVCAYNRIIPLFLVYTTFWLSSMLSSVLLMQELLQNAEDAGATVVKFLYDSNGFGQDSSKLSAPRLAKYQVVCVCLLRFTMLYFIACCSFSVIVSLRATMLINLNLNSEGLSAGGFKGGGNPAAAP